MKITYLGHATLYIEWNDKKIIVDPFVSANELASGIDINDYKADYILVTHAHQDHILDVDTVYNNSDSPLIITNYELYIWYGNKGMNAHPMNHGGKYDFGFATIKYVNAIHTSGLPDGSYGGQPGGFVLYDGDKCIYIAGDTALTRDMELIPMTCPKVDLAVLPIGDNFTMGYEDAAIASDFIQCDTVLGYHYDTFPPIKLDKEKASAHFSSKGKTLLLPAIGGSIDI